MSPITNRRVFYFQPRWQIECENVDKESIEGDLIPQSIMNNYFSIGVVRAFLTCYFSIKEELCEVSTLWQESIKTIHSPSLSSAPVRGDLDPLPLSTLKWILIDQLSLSCIAYHLILGKAANIDYRKKY